MFTNISRSEGNQPMKFGQLIEYNIRNIFLVKSYTRCGIETIPRPSNYQNKTINNQIVSPLRSQQVQELENSINSTYAIGYGLLDNIFQILDTENMPVTQIIPSLTMLSKKMKVILPTLSKNSIIL